MSSMSVSAISNWVVPSLHTVELSVWTWDPENNPPLRLFIQSHGPRIRAFSLTLQYGGALISGILGHCPNLRFLRITSESFPILDLSQPHEKLETFIFKSMLYPDMNTYLPTFEAFTMAAQNLLPSMFDAKICYQDTEMARFHASDGSAVGLEGDEGPVGR